MSTLNAHAFFRCRMICLGSVSRTNLSFWSFVQKRSFRRSFPTFPTLTVQTYGSSISHSTSGAIVVRPVRTSFALVAWNEIEERLIL